MKHLKIALYILIITFFGGASALWANTFDTWHWRNPTPYGFSPNAITCGGGVCVAVGNGGTILTSADGGGNWTPHISGTSSSLAGVAYGSGIFVAVGPNGVAIYSTDLGATWQAKNAASNYSLSGVASGPLGFVAVGNDNGQYQTAILTIADPRTDGWVVQNHGTKAGNFLGVACSDNTVVAVGSTGIVTTWKNGTWQSATSTITVTLYAVAYGTASFTAVGESGTIITSFDGVSWTAQASKVTKSLRSVAYGSGVFVAVGPAGIATTSANGSDWTPRNTQTLNDLTIVAAGGPGLIAAGSSGTLITSTNGILWTNPGGDVTGDSQNTHLEGVAYGNGRFVAVGRPGAIIVSSDNGQTWIRSVSPTSATLHGVAYGGGHYCVVGANGTILTSSDGARWIPRNSGTTEELFGVAYGNGKFVAVGKNGVGVVSADLVNWQVVATGYVGELRAVAYGLGRFAAVGIPTRTGSADNSCYLYTTSTDGAAWSPSAATFGYYQFYGLGFGESGFIAVGWSDQILGSTNGTDWTMSGVLPAYSYMNAIAYGNGWNLSVGNNGTIYGPNGTESGKSKWLAFPLRRGLRERRVRRRGKRRNDPPVRCGKRRGPADDEHRRLRRHRQRGSDPLEYTEPDDNPDRVPEMGNGPERLANNRRDGRLDNCPRGRPDGPRCGYTLPLQGGGQRQLSPDQSQGNRFHDARSQRDDPIRPDSQTKRPGNRHAGDPRVFLYGEPLHAYPRWRNVDHNSGPSGRRLRIAALVGRLPGDERHVHPQYG